MDMCLSAPAIGENHVKTKELRGLPLHDAKEARKRYAELYERAMPFAGGIELERIEVATFNCSSTWKEFEQVGLGVEIVVIFRDENGEGHTGKVLLSLPWQFLPEHGHVDTFVLKPGASPAPGFILVRELMPEFKGIRAYESDGTPAMDGDRPRYVYRDDEFVIVQVKDNSRPQPYPVSSDVIREYPGKSETFKMIYGDGVLFTDHAQVIKAPKGRDPEHPPAEFREAIERTRRDQKITTQRLIHMSPGTHVLLPKATRHAFLAGRQGAVFLEFSTPSMDEADRFTDERIIR